MTVRQPGQYEDAVIEGTVSGVDHGGRLSGQSEMGITTRRLTGQPMSEEVVVLKTFNNEIDAEMAQQVLHEAGVTAFVFKDDAGGMEPQLQQTNGVRLVVNRADAQHAQKMLKT